MKKLVLLSVVASSVVMAGGDIAPVEPVVEVAPMVETSNWDFTGYAVAFTQTRDSLGGATSPRLDAGLFSEETTAAGLGLELGATNKDLAYGIGVGAKVATIGTASQNSITTTNFGQQYGSALTEGYLTYGFTDTSFKIGRQPLPKGLSPFAFTEGWQMIKNTFDAALVVNSSLPDTTLVGAFVTKANGSVNALPGGAVFPWIRKYTRTNGTQYGYDGLDDFQDINDDGVFMVTAQNKSIENLTLTGTAYFAPDHTNWLGVTNGGDTRALWADAKYHVAGMFMVAVQGGQIAPDGYANTNGYGAKIGGHVAGFHLAAAFSSVDDGAVRMANFGTSVKTPLYTQSILDQDVIAKDADTFKLSASTKVLGGTVGAHFINAELGAAAIPAVMYPGTGAGAGTYNEIDLTYKTKVGESTTLFAGYVYQNDDRVETAVAEQQNFLRFWARYNFK